MSLLHNFFPVAKRSPASLAWQAFGYMERELELKEKSYNIGTNTENNPNARIFIVDDELINVRILTAVVKKDGFTNITGITDSREVTRLFQEMRPDIIVTPDELTGL